MGGCLKTPSDGLTCLGLALGEHECPGFDRGSPIAPGREGLGDDLGEPFGCFDGRYRLVEGDRAFGLCESAEEPENRCPGLGRHLVSRCQQFAGSGGVATGELGPGDGNVQFGDGYRIAHLQRPIPGRRVPLFGTGYPSPIEVGPCPVDRRVVPLHVVAVGVDQLGAEVEDSLCFCVEPEAGQEASLKGEERPELGCEALLGSDEESHADRAFRVSGMLSVVVQGGGKPERIGEFLAAEMRSCGVEVGDGLVLFAPVAKRAGSLYPERGEIAGGNASLAARIECMSEEGESVLARRIIRKGRDEVAIGAAGVSSSQSGQAQMGRRGIAPMEGLGELACDMAESGDRKRRMARAHPLPGSRHTVLCFQSLDLFDDCRLGLSEDLCQDLDRHRADDRSCGFDLVLHQFAIGQRPILYRLRRHATTGGRPRGPPSRLGPKLFPPQSGNRTPSVCVP